jgi:hypothetical protein
MLIDIDVAKAELVVAARPSGERWTVANDERGVHTLVERLRVEAPEQGLKRVLREASTVQ